MSWFGEGLSSLKGQLQNFTKEVLADGADQPPENDASFLETKRKCEELEALCEAQNLEISALRKQITQLERQKQEGSTQDENFHNEESSWWTVEHRWDPAYSNGSPKAGEKDKFKLQKQEKELKEKDDLIKSLTNELSNLKKNYQKLESFHNDSLMKPELLPVGFSESINGEVHNLPSLNWQQLLVEKEEKTSALEKQLAASEKTIEELQMELQNLKELRLNSLNEAQVRTSELPEKDERGSLGIKQKNGIEESKILKAQQDTFGHIGKIKEKNRETECSVKELQAENQDDSSQVLAEIQRLGSSEHQERIHDSIQEEEDKDHQLEDIDTIEFDTFSLRSEISDLSLQKNHLESQILKLKKEIEICQNDLQESRTVKNERAECNLMAEDNISDLKLGLKEKEEALNIVTTQKNYLHSEIEAMARVIQDLESQLANLKEDNESLNVNIEELDKQHQDAIGQLLDVKLTLQKQNEALQSELQESQVKIEDFSKLEVVIEELKEENAILHQEIQKLKEQNIQVLEKEGENENIVDDKISGILKEWSKKIKKIITVDVPKEFYNSNENEEIITDVEALVKLCNDYKWKKEMLERKVVEMMKEINDSKQSLNDHEETITRLEKECKSLKHNVETLVEELDVFKSGSKEILSPIPESNEDTEVMEQKIIGLQNEIEILREARFNLEADGAKLRENEQALLKQLHSMEAMLRNQENMQRESAKWQEVASNANAQVEEILRSKLIIEAELDRLEKEKQTFSKLQILYEETQEELKKEKDVAVQLQDKINSLEHSKADLESNIQMLEQKLKEKEEEAKNYQVISGKLAESESCNIILQAKIDALEKKVVNFANNNEDLKKEIREAHEVLEVTKNKLMEAEDGLERKDKALGNLKERFTYQEQEIIALREEREELKKTIAKLSSELSPALQNTEKELTSLKNQLILSEKLSYLLHKKLNINFEKAEALVSDSIAFERKLFEIEKCNIPDILTLQQQKDEAVKSESEKDALLCLKDEEISNLIKEKDGLQTDLKALQELQTECSQLQSKLSNSQSELEEVSERMAITEVLNEAFHKKLNVPYQASQELVRNYPTFKKKLLEIENLSVINENDYENLKLDLESKEHKITELKLVVETLEQKLNNISREKQELEIQSQNLLSNLEKQDSELSDMIRWKEIAKATERQLDEALKTKSELENECGRLFAIETKVHNTELLEKEIARLRNLCDETETQMAEATRLNIHLQQQCDSLKTEIYRKQHLQQEVQNLKQLVSEKDNEISEFQQRLLALHEKCETLSNMEKLLHSAKNEAEHWKNEFTAVRKKLQEEKFSKDEFILLTEKLKHAEIELNSKKDLEKERMHLQGMVQILKTKYDEESCSRMKLEEQLKQYKEIHSTKSVFVESAQEIDFGQEKCDIAKDVTDNKKKHRSDVYETNKEYDLITNKIKCGTQLDEDNYITSIDSIQEERSKMLSLIEENNMLRAENVRLKSLVIKDDSNFSHPSDDEHNLNAEQIFQKNEVTEMAKETIGNLSKMIKEKDVEIQTLQQKVENMSINIQSLQQQISHLQSERDELVKTIHIKHQESVQYHSEIQRLSGLLSIELKKSQEIQQQNKGLVQQHEDKQKLLLNTQNEVISLKQRLERIEANYIGHSNSAEVRDNSAFSEGNHTDELKSIIANKDQLIERSDARIKVCEQELQAKQQEIEFLYEQVRLLQAASLQSTPNNDIADNVLKSQSVLPSEKVMSNELPDMYQIKVLEDECQKLKDNLLQERAHVNYLQSELQEREDKEESLQKELDRLRAHLVAVEEGYTQETLRAEEQVRTLQTKLEQAEERIKSSSTAYTSASILVNQQVEALQNQNQLLIQQRDEARSKLNIVEDQIQKHEAALCNLQAVLEQFQRDKDREISLETLKMQKQVQAAQKKHEQLEEEINSLKVQLVKANEGLSAASRLGEQLERKSEIIASLKEKVAELTDNLNKIALQKDSSSVSCESKVDRNLMKNLILGYFSAPVTSRTQVLRVLASVLEMDTNELERLGLSHTADISNQSLSEAFIRFLESESQPQPRLRLLPQAQQQSSRERATPSPGSSSSASRPSPLLLSEVHLPEFTQFPVSRNSSSILKDVLKDS